MSRMSRVSFDVDYIVDIDDDDDDDFDVLVAVDIVEVFVVGG